MRAGLDVLIVGAGPAGLATAIRLKQQLGEAADTVSMAVIDKAPQPGYHNLSGAVVTPRALDELTPDWRTHRALARRIGEVEQDDMYFLLGSRAIKIPELVAPSSMDHRGDAIISISRLTAYLAAVAEERGIEVYTGFSARDLLVEDGRVRGVRLGEVGLDADGGHMANYRPAEEIRARVTVLADGPHGVLSTQLRERFGQGANPQVYSLGVKAVMQFPEEHPFGEGRVASFLGYPNPANVFGGGFIYSMDANTVAVGLIMALDWKYADLNPQREFERFRQHPFIAEQLKGGVAVATGARTIPEGGYYALGKVSVPGALVVGDGAGFVNMEKIKGIHNAIWSGMAAAEAIAAALADAGAGEIKLKGYQDRLEERGVLPEMRGYVPLPAGIVIAARVSLGLMAIFSTENEVDEISQELGPTTERFRGGGTTSNRGFLPGELGDGPFGGTHRWLAAVEFRFPITSGFSLVTFADTGDVSLHGYRFDHPQLSVGGALRIMTPVGPIRLDIGWRVPGAQVIGEDERFPGGDPGQVNLLFAKFPGAVNLIIGDSF